MSDERLPDELRERAVKHLREGLHPETLDYLRELHRRDPEFGDEITAAEHAEYTKKYGFTVPQPFHFGTGMAIRNFLREVILDEELPPVYYGALETHNWDDWYQDVIVEAIAE